MEKRFKQAISRLFRSCRSRNIADIVQEPVFLRRDFILLDSSSPEIRAAPFIFRRKSKRNVESSQEMHGRRRCPLSLNSFHTPQKLERKKKMKKPTEKKTKATIEAMLMSTSSTDSLEFFSSDGETEQETMTLFSSKIFSSESPEICGRHEKNSRKSLHIKFSSRNSSMGFPSMMRGKVHESVAVVKSSKDPYGDFRRSMVEMIIEKQMFSVRDLEQLLHCFLSLNSSCHHEVIIKVFSDVLEALFSNSP